MRFRSPLLAISLLILLLVSTPATSAHAHANLLQSIPEANARLDSAPVIVELFFSEPIEAGFSMIQVLDTSGKRVDNDDAAVDPGNPTRLTATVRSLPAGIYTVSWRTLSSVDSHVTAGAFPFAVGNVDEADLAAAAQANAQLEYAPGEVAARWLTYLAVMTLAGSALFILLVWQPAIRDQKHTSGDALRPPWRQMTAVSLLVLLLAEIIWLLVQAGQVSGTAFAFPWQESVTKVLFMTRFGALWAGRLLLALLWLWLAPRAGSVARWMGLLLGLLMALTLSLGSHAAASAEPLLPLSADWAHLTAASVWVGGLFHFLVGLMALRQLDSAARTRLTAGLISRFSALAIVSVSLLVLTGVYGAVVQVGSWAALAGSAYGRVLLVKLGIFLPMLALGAVNLLLTAPGLKRAAANDDDHLVSRFRRLVMGEVVLGVVALLSVSLLTAMAVPEEPDAKPALRETAVAGDLDIELEISPGRVGLNSFTVTLAADGDLISDAGEVSLLFTPVTADLPPSEARLEPQGEGAYRIEGGFLAMPDAWQVQTAVRRPDRYDSFANFNLSVGTNTAVSSLPWHRISGGLLLAAGGVILSVMPTLGQWKRRSSYGRVPALLLALVGAVTFVQPPVVEENPILPNPIPPNANSITAGKGLYQKNCVPCHGVSGAGDGPVGLALNPPPADLTQHTIPGVHPDGRLYNWITNGVEGSVMPVFGKALTDEERWHVVNYIRTLSQPGSEN